MKQIALIVPLLFAGFAQSKMTSQSQYSKYQPSSEAEPRIYEKPKFNIKQKLSIKMDDIIKETSQTRPRVGQSSDDPCMINENINLWGPSRCITDNECLGKRTCDNHFNCVGKSQCSIFKYQEQLDNVANLYAQWWYNDQSPETYNHVSKVEQASKQNNNKTPWMYQTYTTKYRNYGVSFNYDYMNDNSYKDYQGENYFEWTKDIEKPDKENYDLWKKNWNIEITGSDDVEKNPGVIPEFTKNMKCGDCLRLGYIFCQKSKAWGSKYFFEKDKPQSFCCHDKWNCPQNIDKMQEWECSSEYTDPLFAYQMCPNDESKCGIQNVELEEYERPVKKCMDLDENETFMGDKDYYQGKPKTFVKKIKCTIELQNKKFADDGRTEIYEDYEATFPDCIVGRYSKDDEKYIICTGHSFEGGQSNILYLTYKNGWPKFVAERKITKVRNMMRGDTCSYRITNGGCNYPLFAPSFEGFEDDRFNFNLTINEWEDFQVNKMFDKGKEYRQNVYEFKDYELMASVDTAFVDSYYKLYKSGQNIVAQQTKYPGIDMMGYVNIPKRGYYDFRKLGWKGFNSWDQAFNDDWKGLLHKEDLRDPTRLDFTHETGGSVDFSYNPILTLEDERDRTPQENIDDKRCQDRSTYITITAVEDNSNFDMNFMLDIDSVPIPTPPSKQTFTFKAAEPALASGLRSMMVLTAILGLAIEQV